MSRDDFEVVPSGTTERLSRLDALAAARARSIRVLVAAFLLSLVAFAFAVGAAIRFAGGLS